MGDLWYRGEAVGVPQAAAGTVSNDIGDGMYLTDQLQVAEQYARERTSNPADQRVYLSQGGQSGLKVLDLTKDPRWRKTMSMPLPGQPGETLETMLKRQPSSQQYKNIFEGFLKSNKIDLKNFDAVIGDEYRSGGRQMCILYKNGQSSPVQIRLRGQFVRVGSPLPTTATPTGTLRFRGKIGPGMRTGATAIGSAGVMLLMGWLLGKVIEKQQEASLARQMEEIRPAIEAAIKRDKEFALKLLADGKSAFATVRIMVKHQQHYDPGGMGYMPTAPSLEFVSLMITEKDQTTPKGQKDGEEHDYFLSPGAMLFKDFYKMSFPVTFSQDEIDLYRAYVKEIEWYEDRAKSSPSAPDTMRLNNDRDELVRRLKSALSDQ